MKPGRGKAHKSCATLCILGGIPPSLMVKHEGDADDYTLLILTGPDGESIKDTLLPFVADPIRVSGRMEQFGSLKRLRIDPETIERL